MSQETLNRDEVIRDFSSGRLSRKEAAGALGKSERQVSRMMGCWRRKGVLGLEHGLVGRAPANRTSEELRERVLSLLQGKYAGFNFLHFHEHLIRVEKIPDVSYSSVKRIACAAGQGREKRRRGKARKRRARFAQAGYMLQMDGSKHFWWKGEERCLIAGIDDATSDVPCGEFFKTETLEGYMRVLRKIIEIRGIPRIIYVDRASWLGGTATDEEKSQFRRMCEELGIRVIHANSPEAKGRVERLWGTLQDRLVSELRLHGIASMERASFYLNETFIPETWSKKFTVAAESAAVLYRPRPMSLDLDQIFCLKFDRKLRRDHTVLFANEVYGVTANLPHSIARKNAEIRIYCDGRIRGYYGGKDLELRQERKGNWGKHENAKSAPGLTTWLRVLGTDLSVHSDS